MTQSPGQSICFNPGEEQGPRKQKSTCDSSWKWEERVPHLIFDDFLHLF